MTPDEIQERARRKLAGIRRRTRDPRFSTVMGRFAGAGLLVTNRAYERHKNPLAVADVLYVGEVEPRVLELLPALIVKRPSLFVSTDDLPKDLAEAVRRLRHDEVPRDFRGIPGRSLHEWLRRVGHRGKVPSRLKSFRFKPADQRLLDELTKRLGISETEVIRRGLRALM
jgi:radical SAM superfamily enzyme YgiQ (UPF0313 family)